MNFLFYLVLITIDLIICDKIVDPKPYLDEVSSQRLQHVLDSIPSDKIPNKFKTEIDNSHWCCKIDPPVTYFEKTKIATREITESEKRKCGSFSCGFLGLSSCTRWCITYRNVMVYFQDIYVVYQQERCPDQYITCCKDHFLILGHCYHILEIYGNVDLLAEVNKQGIVIPIVVG